MSEELTDGFRIDEHRREDGVVLAVHGDLDMASADALTRRLDALRGAGEPTLLDLDDVAFMDSSGLRAVLLAMEARGDGAWRFSLTPGSEQVRRLFTAAGVIDRLPLARRP